MNMISTGAFQTEMDASNKQATLAEKFAAVWEKKNAKAARAGGVSLMALSLAACGSDDDTTTTDTSTDTTTTTTTATNQNLSLTTGIDTVVAGAGNDSIIGSAGGTNATIIAGDSVDGGAGDDTMLVSVSGTTTVAAGLTLSNVETVRIVDTATTSGTVNLAGSTGVTTIDVNASSGAALSVTNVGNLVGLNLTNTAGSGTTTLTYASSVVSGSADAQTVTMSNAAATGNITIAGVETLNVANSTDGSTGTFVVAAASTVNLTGAGDTTLTLTNSSNTALTTVDASAATGDSTIAIDADLDVNGVSVTAGAGDDTINISEGALGATDSVDGGAGSDTLLWREDTSDITSVANASATISNIETLSLRADDNGAAAAVDFTIDLDTTEGVSAVKLNARDTNTASVFTLNDLSDTQAEAITLSYGASATGATVAFDMKDGSGSATSNPEKGTVNATIIQGSTTTIQDDSDTMEELTVNVTSSAATQTLTIDAADFDASLTVTGGAAGTTLDMDATNITSDIVNMSGVTSNILFAGGSDTQTITGGSGDDKFTMTTFLDHQDSIDGGAGNDRVVIDPAASITQAPTLTNIEELEIGATATVSLTLTGQVVPEIVLQGQNAVTNVVTLTNAAGVTNILADGGAANNDDDFNGLTFSGTGYAATTDALTMSMVADTDTVTTGAMTFTGIEDLTIAVTGSDSDFDATINTGITGSSLNNVTVTSSGYGAASTSTDIVLGNINDGGSDTMLSFDASGANTGVSATLADMQASSTVTGSEFYDTISVAGSGANVIVNGGAGNDTLTAATGATTLNGGAGNDTLNGGAGDDLITSGTGNDTIDGNGGDDTVTLGVGNHTIVHAGDGTGDGAYTISGFTAGAAGDVFDLQSNAASESGATVSNFESVANAGTVSAGTGLVVVGGTSIGGTAESDVETLLGGGAANITLLGAFDAATDEFYLLTDDGTNSYLFNVDSGGTTAGVTAAEETITLYATFSGISDCATFTAANFADFL